jgi:acyl carrier protein
MHDPITPEAILTLLVREQILDTDEPLTTQSDLFALGMDSLALMQLLLHLEQSFGIQVLPEEMTRERLATPQAMADSLRSKLLA